MSYKVKQYRPWEDGVLDFLKSERSVVVESLGTLSRTRADLMLYIEAGRNLITIDKLIAELESNTFK